MIDSFVPVVTASSPFLLGVFAWLTGKRINNRKSEDERLQVRLTQQREDFNTLLEPLQTTVRSLYERVEVLENRANLAEGNTRTLPAGLRDTLEYLEDRYQDPGPHLSLRVRELLEHT